MELTPHNFAPTQRFASFLTRFLKLLLEFWLLGVILNAFYVFRLIRLQESKYEIAKHSAFNRCRSHYDIRCFDFVGAGAG